MSKIHRRTEFPISVERDEIARVLGYGQSKIPKRVQGILRGVEEQAKELISTACAYRYLKNEEFSHSEYLSCLENVVLCLVTIGGDLENAVEEQKKADDLSRALILDSYGSAAAEATAEAAEAVIQNEIKSKGLKCSTRFSPGYGGWNVAEQEWILPVLEGEALGVRLTEGCMMVPRKSITFAITYGESAISLRDKEMCEDCEMVNCRFKRVVKKAR